MIFWAFLRKDTLTSTSYRALYVIGSVSVVMTVLSYFYLARLVAPNSPVMAKFGGDYFPFVVLGMAVSEFLGSWLHSLAENLREAQLSGTLETLMCTPVSSGMLIAGVMIWPLVSTAAFAACYLLLANLFVGLKLDSANWFAAAVIALLAFAAFTGLALMSAAFVLVFKKGDPITMLFTAAGFFLSGVMFPVELLPAWLRPWAALIPLTPAIEGIRMSLLRGFSLSQLTTQWQSLALMAALFLPAGLLALRAAFHRLRLKGSFTHY